MPDKQPQTIKEMYRRLVGQPVTVHLVNGETVNGMVLDAEAGDLLLRRTGYEDLVLIPRHGLAALSSGGEPGATGAPASTTIEGGAEGLPQK